MHWVTLPRNKRSPSSLVHQANCRFDCSLQILVDRTFSDSLSNTFCQFTSVKNDRYGIVVALWLITSTDAHTDNLMIASGVTLHLMNGDDFV